jgi:hypothetical protein
MWFDPLGPVLAGALNTKALDVQYWSISYSFCLLLAMATHLDGINEERVEWTGTSSSGKGGLKRACPENLGFLQHHPMRLEDHGRRRYWSKILPGYWVSNVVVRGRRLAGWRNNMPRKKAAELDRGLVWTSIQWRAKNVLVRGVLLHNETPICLDADLAMILGNRVVSSATSEHPWIRALRNSQP